MNLILALFPLLICGIGLSGLVLGHFGDPAGFALSLAPGSFPDVARADRTVLVEQITQSLLARRTGIVVAGAVFLPWVFTRLSASASIWMLLLLPCRYTQSGTVCINAGCDCGDVRSVQPQSPETGSPGRPPRWPIIPRRAGTWCPAPSSFSGSITNRWCLR